MDPDPSIGTGTDNHLARWDGTGVQVLQDSPAVLADNGNLTLNTTVSTGRTISLTNDVVGVGSQVNLTMGPLNLGCGIDPADSDAQAMYLAHSAIGDSTGNALFIMSVTGTPSGLGAAVTVDFSSGHTNLEKVTVESDKFKLAGALLRDFSYVSGVTWVELILDPNNAAANAQYAVVQSGVLYAGDTGTIQVGATVNGGIVSSVGSGGAPMANPGDGIAGGTYS